MDRHHNNTLVGQQAEDHAVRFLESRGFEILDRNWRFQRAEIDIIARRTSIIHFIEVKSRRSVYFGEPETAVDLEKTARIIDAANAYMRTTGHDWAIQFDIIAIVLDGDQRPSVLKYLEDVFF